MATRLTDAQIAESLGALPGWMHEGSTITKTYQLDTYMAGLAFAAAVGTVCEGLGHHPDLYIGWKKVKVTFSTHDAGNVVTEKDINAAKAIEALNYPKPK
jgi:4a-hydroxytetrahydrobiopterin dehydratase